MLIYCHSHLSSNSAAAFCATALPLSSTLLCCLHHWSMLCFHCDLPFLEDSCCPVPPELPIPTWAFLHSPLRTITWGLCLGLWISHSLFSSLFLYAAQELCATHSCPACPSIPPKQSFSKLHSCLQVSLPQQSLPTRKWRGHSASNFGLLLGTHTLSHLTTTYILRAPGSVLSSPACSLLSYLISWIQISDAHFLLIIAHLPWKISMPQIKYFSLSKPWGGK